MRKLSWCLLLSACGGGLERASYMTDAITYAAGARVELRLVNVSARDLRVDLCISQLVKEDGAGADLPGDEDCPLEQVQLAPGEEARTLKTLPSDTPAGRYRYEATIVLPIGAGERVFTQPFTVE